ncbi:MULTISPECIES: electron transport complex subunit RsxA [unclassified Fusibacter]|uniref:electron transport complex subunit RsxA n=1 Tax=unclassified Fusibacter TaxID=2624464 RepID=UPI001010B8BC|nr:MULTISPECIES: electron transport complex subunit RsxA [unclassified Fusibacter]MCK8060663.1 electron transport complex subunit RsxA [Fusibacter sp. A2]NPE22883.1 electron transport complex subunit RsxA [Fusibacter sp. A1]RXV59951.1 electron transport complex subunit RsxA [Fusibacter sp. A1]
MDFGGLFVILVGAILVNNFVLSRFLGICPFLGVSKQVETAAGMGMAVTFVMTMAGIITWIVQKVILETLHLEYLQTIAFILVIASLVQFVEIFLQKVSPTLYQSLGVFLPLITTNCAVLGLALLNIQFEYNLLETIVHSIGAAVGFSLAIILFAGIREKLEISNIPAPFKGFPIALITASLMSMAFFGFAGLV